MKQRGSTREPATETRDGLRAHYDRMWSEALPAIRAGRVEVDSVLAAGQPDRRRGLTLMARPSWNVRRRVASWLEQLRELEPDQYYYVPPEFHITVLSMFTANVHAEPFLARTAEYASAVGAVARNSAPFGIEFAGVTASPGAVMIQGFSEDGALNAFREGLRKALRGRGLGDGLDARYRLVTAHMTVVRFRAPLRDPKRFALALEQARSRPFGPTCVRTVNLVGNDWYMSRHSFELVRRYRLVQSRTKCRNDRVLGWLRKETDQETA